MNTRQTRRLAIYALVIAILLACAAYAKPILGPGDRMVFLGDSKRWREISLVQIPKEAEKEQQALLNKMDKLVEAKDHARTEATARRNWQWSLTLAP